MLRSNAHTHCDFCDGQATAEQMVLAAIDKGFDVLGFSCHGYTDFDLSYCMSLQTQQLYKQEIARLSDKYRGKITLLAGVERDFFSHEPLGGFAYIIGSVHYLRDADRYYPIDYRECDLQAAIDELYGGDALKAVAAYYDQVAAMAHDLRPDVIGHFDMIRKLNGGNRFFDEQSGAYRALALAALEKCARQDLIFEVNTGCISRGFCDTPFPDIWLLQRLADLDAKVCFAADAHTPDALDCRLDEVTELLRRLGFKQLWALTAAGFAPQEL